MTKIKSEEEIMKEVTDESEADWIETPEEKIPTDQGEYEVEMWLSTDGKNTVRVKTNNPLNRREAIKKGMELYDYILARYGTKQGQAVKEYNKTPVERKEDDKEKQETCEHPRTKFLQVKKDGKNKGRWFKQCEDCRKFLGFTD